VSRKQDKPEGTASHERLKDEIADACERLAITPDSLLANLKRLSTFSAPKPFSFQGQILYSEPIDHSEVQLGATKVLADILGMKEAERLDPTGGGPITIRIKGKDEPV
jgi:hypothetical protein